MTVKLNEWLGERAEMRNAEIFHTDSQAACLKLDRPRPFAPRSIVPLDAVEGFVLRHRLNTFAACNNILCRQ